MNTFHNIASSQVSQELMLTLMNYSFLWRPLEGF